MADNDKNETAVEETPSTPYHETLLEGIANVKSREDGSVHTIHAPDGKTTLAEICVGKRATRINFRQVPSINMMKKEGKGIELVGKSKTWLGQGTKVTDENVGQIRTLLLAVIAKGPKATEPTAADAADLLKKQEEEAEAERVRLAEAQELETANA